MDPEFPITVAEPTQIGAYQIISRLASGGMGDVFLARDVSGHSVAIKCFRRSALPSMTCDELHERFGRECSVLAAVSHPNIVRIVEHGVDIGRPFLVMEYVDGGNLRQLLDRQQRPDIPRIRRIVASLAQAISYLHAKGIVHRDLKPENVLIDRAGQVQVTDFGLASPMEEIGSLTLSGQVLGSADYMAPEQRHHLPVDVRADQYSLSVILYEMLTGEKPLGIFKPPSKINLSLTSAMDDIVMRGLQKDPDDRFESVDQLAAEFERAAVASQADIRIKPARRFLVLATASVLGVVTYSRLPSNSSTPADQTAPASGPIAGAVARELPQLDSASNTLDEKAVRQVQRAWAEHLSISTTLTNSIGMQLTLVPPGEFRMGLPVGQSEPGIDREGPVGQRRVRISRPFLIGTHEVTQTQYQRFVDAVSQDQPTRTDESLVTIADDDPNAPAVDRGAGPIGNHPVANITWRDAAKFCDWLSELESVKYRLPTEAEWEFACRAGTRSAWSFGDDFAVAGDYSWSRSAVDTADPDSGPTAIAARRPNFLGLFDMHGNVAELCLDNLALPQNETSVMIDPIGRIDYADGKRITRGGGWFASSHRQMCGSRWQRPGQLRWTIVGFRVVREVNESRPDGSGYESNSIR